MADNDVYAREGLNNLLERRRLGRSVRQIARDTVDPADGAGLGHDWIGILMGRSSIKSLPGVDTFDALSRAFSVSQGELLAAASVSLARHYDDPAYAVPGHAAATEGALDGVVAQLPAAQRQVVETLVADLARLIPAAVPDGQQMLLEDVTGRVPPAEPAHADRKRRPRQSSR